MTRAVKRKRTPCQACGTPCRATPVEAMFRGGTHSNSYWRWSSKRLCPPCTAAQLDFWELQRSPGTSAVSDQVP